MGTTLVDLRLRLLDQCYKYKTHHLGSAFSTLPILKEIFDEMRDTDRLVLSNGHASSALYVALEAYRGKDSSKMFELVGDHPKRNSDFGIDCSTGSLGMGITVAVGMALANLNKSIYCVVSDGECAEGSVWEAMRFAEWNNVENLRIFFNINSFVAYDRIDGEKLSKELLSIYPKAKIRFTSNFPFDQFSLEAHYMKMEEVQYRQLRNMICDSNL